MAISITSFAASAASCHFDALVYTYNGLFSGANAGSCNLLAAYRSVLDLTAKAAIFVALPNSASGRLVGNTVAASSNSFTIKSTHDTSVLRKVRNLLGMLSHKISVKNYNNIILLIVTGTALAEMHVPEFRANLSSNSVMEASLYYSIRYKPAWYEISAVAGL